MRRALTEVRPVSAPSTESSTPRGRCEQQIIALRDGSLETPVLEANFKSALVLDELFSEAPFSAAPPELFMFFSSVSAILGLPGQVEYTAATIALDRLAHARSRRAPGRTLSINWSAWRGRGRAGGPGAGATVDGPTSGHDVARRREVSPRRCCLSRRHPRRHAESPAEAALRLGITTAEGVEALDRILATDFDGQIIASAVPLEPWLERLRANASRPGDRDDGASAERPAP